MPVQPGFATFRTLMMAAAFLLPGATAMADSAVWRVSDGSQQIYLGGTVHLLRPSDYPLPAAFDMAYGEADSVYFETDISALSDIGTQMRMMQQLTYSDDRTLRSVLNDEAYAALSGYVAQLGLPMAALEKFRPGLLVSTLQVLEVQQMGFTPEGVDAHFNARAMDDGKPVGELESVESQIGYLARMGEGSESEFVLLSLEDMEELRESIEEMVGAWRSGDNERLADLFVDELREQVPDVYDVLLVERNNAWMPLIEDLFERDGTEFVLVGAAHLVGEDGLLTQLEAKGYQVSQLE